MAVSASPVSSFVFPASASPAFATSVSYEPPNHTATRAVRDVEALIDVVDARLTGKAARYPLLESALLATQHVPQYRRTFIQGCACSTGIAGGGCCPGSATTAAQGGASVHAHGGAMAPLAIFGLMAGAYGAHSSVQVLRNTRDALQNTGRVGAHIEPRLNEAASFNAQLEQHPKMKQTQAAAAHRVTALQRYKRDVRLSTREQKFNRAIPGVLQLGATTWVTLASVNELGLGFMGALGGCIAGCIGAGLFAIYGGVMGAKNLLAYASDRLIHPVERGEGLAEDYRTAVNEHLAERLKNNKRTGLAWMGVAAAGVLGAVVAAGALVFPFAWAVVAGVALVSAGWALWQNSRTRYVPHLPISPHVQREDLVTPEQRVSTWRLLAEQDQAIKAAVAQIAARQPRTTRIKYDVERLFKPQCGPKAFRVLSNAVHDARGAAALDPAVLRADYEQIQIDALTTYVAKERALLLGRYKDKSNELNYRLIEMKALVDPCCEAMTRTAHQALSAGAATEALYTQASTELRDEAATLELAARKLTVLDQLSEALATVRDEAGALRAPRAAALSEAQTKWLYVRLNMLQLSGTLGDAESQDFIARHPTYFSRNSKPYALPINNLYVLPEHIESFALAIAAELDGAFVHAFFNPRRIEAEMDFIIDHELTNRQEKKPAEETAPAAPQCDGGTCCR